MKFKKKLLIDELSSKLPEEDEKFIQDFFTYTCRQIREWTYEPDNLILSVPKLGKWHVRKAKLEKRLPDLEFYSEDRFNNAEENKRISNWMKKMLDQYVLLLQKKKEVTIHNYGDAYKANYKEFINESKKTNNLSI